MKQFFVTLAAICLVANTLQAQIRDGKPHAYRSTLDTCQKENYSVVAFAGEKIYLGSKCFEAGQALHIEDEVWIEHCSVWDFLCKDDNGNSIYLLETDTTKRLIVLKSPKFIATTEDTLRHLSSSALAKGKLEWDNPYFDESLSPKVHFNKCNNCDGLGKRLIHFPDGSKRNITCGRCGGYGNVCLIISEKRATGVALPPPNK